MAVHYLQTVLKGTLCAAVAAAVLMGSGQIASAHDWGDDYYYERPYGYDAPYDYYGDRYAGEEVEIIEPPARYVDEPPVAIERHYGHAYSAPRPIRPRSCGENHYWNGSYCADARWEPPYVGPKW